MLGEDWLDLGLGDDELHLMLGDVWLDLGLGDDELHLGLGDGGIHQRLGDDSLHLLHGDDGIHLRLGNTGLKDPKNRVLKNVNLFLEGIAFLCTYVLIYAFTQLPFNAGSGPGSTMSH